MKANNGSATAIAAAKLRAVHQLIDGDEKLLDDQVILKLVPEDVKTWILNNRYHYYEPAAMAFRTHILLRSRYAEDRLKIAVEQGVSQFLILGAGLDTFAYRQPDWGRNIKILEIDHPASQREKLAALQHHQIDIPSNVSFLSLDLEKDDLAAALKFTAIDLSNPIFMACLGVLIYLQKNTVEKIFKFASTFAPGSEFVFTISQKKDEDLLKQSAAKVADVGEPWLTHFNHNALNRFLGELGFSNVVFFTAAEAIKMYFENTKLQLMPPKGSSLVRVCI